MLLGYLVLLTGLTISGVAIYYSVIGMAAIFAATPIPIYIMGTTLEIAKLISASWLKANWSRAPSFIKSYMLIAILILMMITSIGIFGFLSKSHMDQNLVSGDVLDRVAIIEEKIKTQRDNIDAAKKALVQMDSVVDQTLVRSTSEGGAGRSAQLRKTQAKERQSLRSEIETAQKLVLTLNDEKAIISKDLRKVESEVGPIKYLAALVYGDNPNQNILERAVTWLIIMIVIVFDPLAVIMLLAAQMSFTWNRSKNTPIVFALDNTEPVFNQLTTENKPDINFDINDILMQNSIVNHDEDIVEDIEDIDNVDNIDDEIVDEDIDTTEDIEDIDTIEDINTIEDIVTNIEENPATKEARRYHPKYIKDPITLDIYNSNSLKPIDFLYKEYAKDKFQGITVNGDDEPELAKFIQNSKERARFNNYSSDILKYYARRIHELRQNNPNNTT